MDNPIVSVIIPTHDRLELLQETIRSMLGQTLKDIEVIVVSNGSFANTRKAVEAFDDSRLRFVEQDDSGGPASPRNHGIRLARGRYVAFCDDDDLYHPDKLQKQASFLDSHPEHGWCICDYDFLEHSTGKVQEREPLPSETGKGTIGPELIVCPFICSMVPVIRKNVLDQVGGFDEDMTLNKSEDWELWLRVAAVCKCGYLSEKLGLYRIHDANASGVRELYPDCLRYVAVMERAVEHAPDVYLDHVGRAARNLCQSLMRQMLVQGMNREVREICSRLKRIGCCSLWLRFISAMAVLPAPVFNALRKLKPAGSANCL